jgi:hypothetical protein
VGVCVGVARGVGWLLVWKKLSAFGVVRPIFVGLWGALLNAWLTCALRAMLVCFARKMGLQLGRSHV